MTEKAPLFRLYGEAPCRVVVLHGGPGAPGCAAGLCRGLAEWTGAAEHLQKAHGWQELCSEIAELIDGQCGGRAAVVGHSYGAWLALLFAEKYPEKIEKAVLIGCGPLEEKYLPLLLETRRVRKEAGLSDTDNYCPLPGAGGDMLYFDEAQHIALMNEISGMRCSGELLERARSVCCPVYALHGAYDPHPVSGVSESMAGKGNFSLTVLDRCGHDPWKEKYAREAFFSLLRGILQGE